MRPPRPRQEGWVKKLPAIFVFLPSMQKFSKNPVNITMETGASVYFFDLGLKLGEKKIAKMGFTFSFVQSNVLTFKFLLTGQT